MDPVHGVQTPPPAVKHTSISVEVSYAETRQANHLRETMSSTATATRWARVKGRSRSTRWWRASTPPNPATVPVHGLHGVNALVAAGFGSRHPPYCRLGHVYQVQPGAAMGQLAVVDEPSRLAGVGQQTVLGMMGPIMGLGDRRIRIGCDVRSCARSNGCAALESLGRLDRCDGCGGLVNQGRVDAIHEASNQPASPPNASRHGMLYSGRSIRSDKGQRRAAVVYDSRPMDA